MSFIKSIPYHKSTSKYTSNFPLLLTHEDQNILLKKNVILFKPIQSMNKNECPQYDSHNSYDFKDSP
jgi:hypothetical protein